MYIVFLLYICAVDLLAAFELLFVYVCGLFLFVCCCLCFCCLLWCFGWDLVANSVGYLRLRLRFVLCR